MDYKKINAETSAVTRKIRDFDAETNNIYESVAIIAKRANQISLEMKQELDQKIDEFSTSQDNLEEIFENREQIEIARYYERLAKPTLISVYEFEHHNVYYRNPLKENSDF